MEKNGLIQEKLLLKLHMWHTYLNSYHNVLFVFLFASTLQLSLGTVIYLKLESLAIDLFSCSGMRMCCKG